MTARGLSSHTRCKQETGGLPSSRCARTHTHLYTLYPAILDNNTTALLEDIFALCGKYRLPQKALRNRKDLSSGEEKLVHDQNQHIPLAASVSNWTYDGYSYVDYIGNRRTLRPDIEPMLDEYVERQNDRITEYNKMLEEVVDLL